MTVYDRTRSGAKKAAKDARKGMKLYVIKKVSDRVAPYEDPYLYSEYTVTHRQAFTGAWMISGSLSVEGLVLRDGPVYTSRPAGLRGIHEPAPQVTGPDPQHVADKAASGRRVFARR